MLNKEKVLNQKKTLNLLLKKEKEPEKKEKNVFLVNHVKDKKMTAVNQGIKF